MKRLLLIAALISVSLPLKAQWTSYGLGVLQQPNAVSLRNYAGVTNVWDGIIAGPNITITVVNRKMQISASGGGGSGTVTTFSAGNLSPLFTTAVANPTTTPALSFSLSSQSANVVFAGPTSGGAAAPTFRSLVAGDIPSLSYVTSVGLSAPSIFAVSGSPVTSAGTLTFSLQNETANTVFAGPSSGVPGTPTFRGLVANDIPSLTLSKISDAGTVAAINLDGNAAHFLDGSGAFSTPGGGGTSLPGLLTRPVRATSDGALSAPTWPDDDTYYFDEEFDSWIGNGNGQFSKNNFTPVSVTTGGAVNNVSSNRPPYVGLIDLQGPTTGNNSFWIVQYGSTGIMPYFALANQSNWLVHAVFNMGATNTGSYVRIGLVDQTYNASIGAGLEPSNCVSLRFSIKESDGNHFWFESRSNGTTVSVQSSIVVATNQFYKVTMMCTNGPGIVLFSINGESWQKLTNTPMQGMCMSAAVGTITSTSQHIWMDRLAFMMSSMNR